MPKTRRQQAAEAASSDEPAAAAEPPKRERKTTARKAPKEKKTTPSVPEVPLAEVLAAAAPAAGPQRDVDKAALIDLLLPRLRERLPAMSDEDLTGLLETTIDSMYPIADLGGLLELEEDQEGLLEAAAAQAADIEEPPSEEPGSAAAAAVPSEDDLLAEARRQAPKPDSEEEEEDSPGPSPQQVMSIKVPITGEAAKYTIEVKAKSPGPVPMEASQATASQGTVEEEAAPAVGVFDPSQLSVRWYPVTDSAFPEKLGERMNLVFPAHKMAPVSWSDMKDAYRTSNETYYAFTVAESPPGSVFGQDYTLVTGDPKKVAAAGVINTHRNPQTGVLTSTILDMGTREDLIPKKGAVNPYLALALRSLAQQLKQPSIVLRYSRKQLPADPEYISTRNTLASLGIPLSSFTAGGPAGKEALFEIPMEERPVDISNVRFHPTREGPERILYEYLEEGTGAVKTFPASAVTAVYALGRRGAELSSIVEFVGTVGTILTPSDAAESVITLPDSILRDGYKRVEPRRGGRRRVTSRRSSSPRQKAPSSGRPRGYTRRRRA